MTTISDVLARRDGTEFAIALSDLVFPRCDRDGFAALTGAERVAYCVDALEREVNNGGFDQFFRNSSGDTAAETLAALERIGAIQAAGLLREALAAFPGGVAPPDRNEREKLVDAMDDAVGDSWSELDGRFQDYPDDLTTMMRAFVEANRGEFRDWP